MSLWAGKLGYSEQTEIKPGQWDDVITEVDARGDLLNRTEVLDRADSILPRYRTTTSISVLWREPRIPDSSIVYVTNKGTRWAISTIVHEFPKIVIYIGEEYDGPLPDGVA